jgi:hypothetical protein
MKKQSVHPGLMKTELQRNMPIPVHLIMVSLPITRSVVN